MPVSSLLIGLPDGSASGPVLHAHTGTVGLVSTRAPEEALAQDESPCKFGPIIHLTRGTWSRFSWPVKPKYSEPCTCDIRAKKQLYPPDEKYSHVMD